MRLRGHWRFAACSVSGLTRITQPVFAPNTPPVDFYTCAVYDVKRGENEHNAKTALGPRNISEFLILTAADLIRCE